jgi:hypothetical protein
MLHSGAIGFAEQPILATYQLPDNRRNASILCASIL